MQSRDACQTSRRARYAIVVAATVVTTLVVAVAAAALCVPWSVAAAASAIGSQQACAQAKCELFSRYVKPEKKIILIKQNPATRRDSTHRKANVNSAKLLNFHTLASSIKKTLCQKLNPMRSKYPTLLQCKGETFTRWRTEPQQLIWFIIVRCSSSLCLSCSL